MASAIIYVSKVQSGSDGAGERWAAVLLPTTRRGCDSQNYFQIVSVPDQSKESQTFHCLLYWFMLLKKQKSLEMILLEFSAL